MALRWVFTADSGPYRKGLAQMRTETKAFSTSITRMMAGVFSAGAIVAGFRSWLREMDRLDKAAKRLGTSVEELQRVSLVGQKADVDLSQLTALLIRLKRRFGEAASGSKAFSARLQSLGLDVAALRNAGPEQLILALSEGWERSNGQLTQYSDLLGLLDTESRNLIPYLEQGPQALADQFERASVVSQKTIDRVAKLNDTLVDMKSKVNVAFGVVLTVFNQLGTTVGEWFGFIFLSLRRLFDFWRTGWQAAGRIVGNTLKFNFKEAKNAAADLGRAVKDTFSGIVRDADAAARSVGKSWIDAFATASGAAKRSGLNFFTDPLGYRTRLEAQDRARADAEDAANERRAQANADRPVGTPTPATADDLGLSDTFQQAVENSIVEGARRRDALAFSRRIGQATELDDLGTRDRRPPSIAVTQIRSIGGGGRRSGYNLSLGTDPLVRGQAQLIDLVGAINGKLTPQPQTPNLPPPASAR